MTFVRLFFALAILMIFNQAALADPCPGFDAAIREVEAVLATATPHR